MCGVGGIVTFNGKPPEPDILARMNAAMRHRGPDGNGTYLHDNVGFAHTRLSIIDIPGGAQPFVDDDLGLALSYNGEVYNYREIRDELKEQCRFKTLSDTEVVLRAYQRWGIDCLERFRGMFAFALHDRGRGFVYLVRDRFGIKPLYFATAPDRLVFASELNAVMCDPGVGRQVDQRAVAAYLYHQYVPTPYSIYEGVKKLEPGHYLEIETATGRTRQCRYWDLRGGIHGGSEKEQLEGLSEILHEIVGIYVRSDVPFGAFLSGGVDSSTVAALMGEHLDRPVKSFTIGYAEDTHSELPFAAEAGRILGTEHYGERISPADLAATLSTTVRHFGEPFGDSSAIPTYWVSQVAARQVKMVLSGDGGDEVFAGYNNYEAILRDIASPGWARGLKRALGRLAPSLGFRSVGRLLSKTPQQIHDEHRMLFPPDDVARITGSPAAFTRTSPRSADGVLDEIAAFQFQDLNTYLLDDILTKVDRMSMANSLEVRVPLLDHKLVEYVFTLPRESRIAINGTGVSTKVILKKLAGAYFPATFLNRPKMGFGIPAREWLLGPLRELVMDTLGDWSSEFYDWIRHDQVQKVLDDFYRHGGREYSANYIWILMTLKLWTDEVHRPGIQACDPLTRSAMRQCR